MTETTVDFVAELILLARKAAPGSREHKTIMNAAIALENNAEAAVEKVEAKTRAAKSRSRRRVSLCRVLTKVIKDPLGHPVKDIHEMALNQGLISHSVTIDTVEKELYRNGQSFVKLPSEKWTKRKLLKTPVVAA